MPRTIRFHLDEHCDPAIAKGLRRRGIDVTTTRDVNLLRASDQAQTLYASATNRVIMSQDEDFLRIHASGIPHPGIAFCRQQSRSIGEIVDALALIWEVMEPEEMRNRVEFL